MDNKNFKIIFIAVAFIIIGVVGIMRAKPDLLASILNPTTENFAPANIVPRNTQQQQQPKVITPPTWGTVAANTAFSDYAPGEMRGGIRLAGQVYKEVTSDGTIKESTKVWVLGRMEDKYQVVYNGYTIWVPLASVKLTGK